MTLRRAPVQTKYFIDGTELEHVDAVRDLGVTIDSKLTFAPHVSDIVRRANRALGLLIRSFHVGTSRAKFNRSAVLAAYFANVRSILEYSSVVWAGAAKSHTVRVDRVQHKFLSGFSLTPHPARRPPSLIRACCSTSDWHHCHSGESSTIFSF